MGSTHELLQHFAILECMHKSNDVVRRCELMKNLSSHSKCKWKWNSLESLTQRQRQWWPILHFVSVNWIGFNYCLFKQNSLSNAITSRWHVMCSVSAVRWPLSITRHDNDNETNVDINMAKLLRILSDDDGHVIFGWTHLVLDSIMSLNYIDKMN